MAGRWESERTLRKHKTFGVGAVPENYSMYKCFGPELAWAGGSPAYAKKTFALPSVRIVFLGNLRKSPKGYSPAYGEKHLVFPGLQNFERTLDTEL